MKKKRIKPPEDGKFLYTRAEAAKALSICLRTLDRLVGMGNIKTVQIGRRKLVSRDELSRFSNSRGCETEEGKP